MDKVARRTLFYCEGVIFDKDYLLKGYSNSNYYISNVINEKTLMIVSKKEDGEFLFNPESEMIKNTKDCLMKTSNTYKISQSENNGISSLPTLSSQIVSVITSSRNYLVPLTGMFGFQASTLMISFIQFNKFFFFLSFSQQRVGGIYEYVNYYLHQTPNFQLQFPVSKKNRYLFAHEYKRMNGDKLLSNDDIISYLTIIFGSACLWIISLILALLRNSEKLTKITELLRKLSIQAFKSAGNSINLMLLISMPLTFKSFQMAEKTEIMAICFIFFFAILALQGFTYYQSLDFLLYKKNLKYSLFQYLKSRNLYETNQKIIRIWLIDQLLLFIAFFAIYMLRKYVDIMLVSSFLVILASIIITKIKYRFVGRIVFFFKMFSHVGLLLFVSLMIFQQYELEVPVIAFDVIYVTSNFAKICEIISFALWVSSTNRKSSRQVHPLKKLNMVIIT